MWWKTAVIYCLDVETFLDWNDDGIGDLAGLAQRLDYLADLGATCVWLMPVFPDQESSVWTYDEKAGQYYLHRFYKHQPDLNVSNPKVRDEVAKILGYWLQLGLSGFRVDAVPFFVETLGVQNADEAVPDPHLNLRHLRAFLSRRSGEAILLGEVNLPHADQLKFFGGPDGDELHMQFDFIGMQALYLSLARADARPLIKALQDRPRPSADVQWAGFVRNHDELTLDKLSDSERQEVFAAFGPEAEMQVYGRGLIRRLPPMLGGDPRRIRMVYSLLFCLPGTPVLFYGEEIGMGENLSAGSRLAVRTPMQWAAEENAGFSRASAAKLPGQIPTGAYGSEFVNVASQQTDPDSLLNFITLLTRTYRHCPELGWGSFEVLSQPHRAVLAHRCTWDDGSLVAVHNLGRDGVAVPLDLGELEPGTTLVDLLEGWSITPDDNGKCELTLEGYGYSWLRVNTPTTRRLR